MGVRIGSMFITIPNLIMMGECLGNLFKIHGLIFNHDG